ncbi:Fic/DOC family N-terminal domain-containing protein [Flavobacterium coralii]|uniref:Fic family protein n=1 Tax=Flavobacterium coralii TaxID=2838017 RepID=UPI000C5F7C16|nr:addiction module protein [Flavobacterium sp.]|tara:strand:- start:60428 stop:61519 length:1092 start_codon:yes stop_codon:yes gene_type:complete
MAAKYKIPYLPLPNDLESKDILKKVAEARAALAELKGTHATVPNVEILLSTLALQEAKDSSAIENIITTHDELFKAELNLGLIQNLAAKEVQRYSFALRKGYELIKDNKIITNTIILEIHKELEQNNAGYRKVPGTDLKNERTGEVIYTPPQSLTEIQSYMSNLIDYINDDSIDDSDYLIKLAVIHHQFESIHPFYDGNGRLGRIINILYLICKGLLDYPTLYLSRFIIQNKEEYYSLLQQVRDEESWNQWIHYILDAVISVSKQSTELIKEIKHLMMHYKSVIRTNYKFYSQDLINNIFKHPYTKIEFLQGDLNISRQTAAKYLDTIAEDKNNLLSKVKIGRDNYYVNNGLMKLFTQYNYKL